MVACRARLEMKRWREILLRAINKASPNQALLYVATQVAQSVLHPTGRTGAGGGAGVGGAPCVGCQNEGQVRALGLLIGWDRISLFGMGGVGWGQEDDDWDGTVKAVDKVLGVEQDPVKRLRDEKLRRDMEARGENLDDDGFVQFHEPVAMCCEQ